MDYKDSINKISFNKDTFKEIYKNYTYEITNLNEEILQSSLFPNKNNEEINKNKINKILSQSSLNKFTE